MIAAIDEKTASNDLDCLHLIWPMIEFVLSNLLSQNKNLLKQTSGCTNRLPSGHGKQKVHA